MKKVLLFVLLSSLCFGQYKGLDSLKLNETIEKITKDTDKNFVISEKGKDKGKFYIKYKNPEKEDDRLMVLYYSFMDGANEALEIKGVKKWNIESVSGNFLSVFPIWQKYSNTKTTKEELSNKKFEYYTTPEGKSSDFVGRGPFWMIRF
ncbi:hypothetical protein [Soonwooa sp.]|uniref:hypothetical protein n=1 Tax=Soonwooa sp. TaxID=1938592 RepID=UPI0028AA5C15|nr:hypothetical protein [Soonwooa sp.]